jgi:hypothetical protein
MPLAQGASQEAPVAQLDHTGAAMDVDAQAKAKDTV